MKRAIGVCLGLVALTAVHCFAAEPAAESKAGPKEKPSPKAAADALQPVIPERKLTFDVTEEELPMQFSAGDPEVAEQRYMATFQLGGGSQLQVVDFGSLRPLANPSYRAAVDRHRDLFLSSLGRLGPSDPLHGLPPRMVAGFRSALGEMPQGRLPSEDIVSLLMNKGYPYLQITHPSGPRNREDRWTCRFTILAPTPERAKELVQGVLSVYDYGVFYPLQKETLAVKQAYEKQLQEDRASLEKVRDERAALQKELEAFKEYEDVTKEALVSFTTQLRLIAVDLVGIQARIDACNKILADRRTINPSRIDQVETVKITAEIELVGLAARKKAIEEIVKKGGQRKELSERLTLAGSRVGDLERNVSSTVKGIAHYEAELTKCMPYPVEDGKVVIRRIKWEPARTRGSGPPTDLLPPSRGNP